MRSPPDDAKGEVTAHPTEREPDLTPLGRTLNEPLTIICEWTERHRAELVTARDNLRRAPRPPIADR